MGKPRALVVDDEPSMAGMITYTLQREEIDVINAYDGEEALLKVDDCQPDIVLLDVMLPRIDGFEVCRRLRQRTTIPVLMLTARKEDADRILGLELGADDYLPKPFNPRELVLRVQKILRWTGVGDRQNSVVAGALTIDFLRRGVKLFDIPVHLTPKEFDLLQCLVSNKGRTLSWESLVRQVWQVKYDPSDSDYEVIKATIRRLRQKIEPDPSKPIYVLSVRGIGYRYEEQI